MNISIEDQILLLCESILELMEVEVIAVKNGTIKKTPLLFERMKILGNLGAVLSRDAKTLAMLDYLNKKSPIDVLELMLKGPEVALDGLMATPFGDKMGHVESKFDELIDKLNTLLNKTG